MTAIDDFASRGPAPGALCRGRALRHLRQSRRSTDAGITPSIDTDEARRARSSSARWRHGELDAGVVYHSDVVASGDTVARGPDPRRSRTSSPPIRSPPSPRRSTPAGPSVRRVRLAASGLGSSRRTGSLHRDPPSWPGDGRRWRCGPGRHGLVFMTLPFIGLLRGRLGVTLGELLTDPFVLEALRLSVVTSLAATVLSLAFGVPMAWLLARTSFPGAAGTRDRAAADGAAAGGRRGRPAVRARPPGPGRAVARPSSSGSCCRSRHGG